MSKQAIKINTSTYIKQGKVEIDGKVWTVKLPGAGTELRMSQVFRRAKSLGARLKIIDDKIDAGKATDADLDKYDDYSKRNEEVEKTIYDFFTEIFQDGTKDNREVKKWVDETSLAIVQLVFEDITKQANSREDSDGEEKSSEKS